MKKTFNTILVLLLIIVLFGVQKNVFAAEDEVIGSYNVIGTENMDYDLNLQVISRSTEFDMDEEKLSFYMLGGDLVEQDEDYYRFIVRNNEYGIKFVFISPEAGRESGAFSTADFYPDRNSIIRVKDVDYVIYTKIDEKWVVQIGDQILDPNIMYVETGIDGDRLVTETEPLADEGNYFLHLNNYTLTRENAEFIFFHSFEKNSLIDQVFDDPGITFRSSDIMLRTFESRLSETNSRSKIISDREPSQAMVGQILRLTGDSDDGDNLAKIKSVNSDTHEIYINPINKDSFNEHDEGTWLRCYNDYSGGVIVPNEYPKISLSPTLWGISENELNALFDTILNADPTGLLSGIDITVPEGGGIGYALQDVTYSSNGLQFAGGLAGSMEIAFAFDFFNRSVDIPATTINYGAAGTSLLEQVLRINTYKKEAIRFNFDPNVYSGYAQYSDMGTFNPPDTFPIRFRLYFDINLNIIGGNIRLNLPGKGIPLPGGLIYVDNIGGGYCYPGRFEVGAKLTSFDLSGGFPLWQAEADMILDLDENYIEVDGSSWIFGKNVQIGDFDATVAWAYYSGKYFKGVEVHGQVGVAKSKVEIVGDITFKVKRYKSDGETKKYIGGKMSASVNAFGFTFGNVSVSATQSRLKGSVYVKFVGWKSISVKYADIAGNITSLSDLPPNDSIVMDTSNNQYGVATLYDGYGNQITLIPEARLLNEYSYPDLLVNTITLSNTIVEGAIVLDYTGDLDDISITLPNGTVKDVVIVQEDTIFDSEVLYAMDYEISDTEKQLYIQIDNPQVGDYVVDSGTTNVSEINLFEITPVPQIEQSNVTYINDVVTLDMELNQDISDAKYHLTLQKVDAIGNVLDEYPLFEDYEDDALIIHEVYVPTEAILSSGVNRSLSVVLPDYLPDGDYRFAIEPLIGTSLEDNLYGSLQYTDSFTVDNPETVAPVTNISSSYLGDGITELVFAEVNTATGYQVVFVDDTGAVVETIGLSTEDLILNNNIDGGMVHISMALEQNIASDVFLANVQYLEEYDYYIYSLLEEDRVVGDVYDSVSGNIIMAHIMDSQDDSYVYATQSIVSSVMFTQYNKISVTAELSGEGFSQNTGPINEEPQLETEYQYDPEDETTDVEIFTIDIPEEIYSMPGLSDIGLSPDQEITRLGFIVQDSWGNTVFEIPLIDLSLYQDYTTYLTFYQQLNSISSQFTIEEFDLLITLFTSNAFSFDGDNINIDMQAIINSGLMSNYEDAIYTVHADLYNAQDDYTPIDFSVRISDYVPGVFVESIIRDGDNYYVNGLVNGATSLNLNDIAATITEGYFEVTIPIQDQTITYALESYYGTNITGTITIEDDINHPTISLSDSSNITVYEGQTYDLPVCTAYDIETLDIECSISSIPDLISAPGIYEIQYYAEDDYGNRSNEMYITLTILEDSIAPVIELNSDSDITITEGESYTLPICSVTDNVTEGMVCDVSYDPAFSLSPGIYEIYYNAIDDAGNEAIEKSITFSIIEDDSPPTIILSSYEDIIIYEGENYTLPTCEASDQIFGGVECVVSYSPELTDTIGEYTITYTATDINGNVAIEEINLTIEEKEVEPITCDEGYHLVDNVCIPSESSSSIGLIIGLITGGSILVVGAGVFFFIKRYRP